MDDLFLCAYLMFFDSVTVSKAVAHLGSIPPSLYVSRTWQDSDARAPPYLAPVVHRLSSSKLCYT
jgi:hypothetical protein